MFDMDFDSSLTCVHKRFRDCLVMKIRYGEDLAIHLIVYLCFS